MPRKLLRVEGSAEEGYSIAGQALTPVGEDEYMSPMGVVRFVKKNGQTLIATQSAITYTKVPFWQARGVQAPVPVLSGALLLLTLVFAAVAPLRGRKRRDNLLIASLALEIALLCALCATIVHGILSFRLLDFTIPMRVLGWGIVAAAVFGAWRARAARGLLRPVAGLWILTSLVLIAQMGWMRILA